MGIHTNSDLFIEMNWKLKIENWYYIDIFLIKTKRWKKKLNKNKSKSIHSSIIEMTSFSFISII